MYEGVFEPLLVKTKPCFRLGFRPVSSIARTRFGVSSTPSERSLHISKAFAKTLKYCLKL